MNIKLSKLIIRSLQPFDKNVKAKKYILDKCDSLDIKQFKNICICGFNSPIYPKNKITIIEPTYYSFFENVKNLTYINKFAYKDNKTHFSLIEKDDPDENFGIKSDNQEPNTVLIDDLGNFNLIITLAIGAYYASLLGAKRSILRNHPVIAHSLYCSDQSDKLYDLMVDKFNYNIPILTKFNDNALVTYFPGKK